MCGIAGSLDIRFDVEAALAAMHHRGPDGHGSVEIGVLGRMVRLLHARLSILDLSPAGHQPMQSRDGRWWVTFNGEIYNHLELREKLDGPFRGHSDTETLVELIARQGVGATLPLLNGMFAFAALDTLEGKLYLTRDPYGIKPVYYHRSATGFGFASEVRTLKAMGLANEGVDRQGLQLFLSLRYTPSPLTLYQGVNRLAPGNVLELDIRKGSFTETVYVAPAKMRFSGSLEDAAEAYCDKLKQAVRRQLLSDVPVGVLLSGGIDSALVAAMAKDAGYALPAFTVGFGGGHEECEIGDAADTARVLDLPFHSVEVTPDSLRDALPQLVNSMEEPLGTTSVMPMWQLVQRARQDVTVVLTGQGTDEPWGGYRRYQVELVRKFLPSAIWKLSGGLAGNFRLPEIAERSLRTLQESDPVKRALEASVLFNRADRIRLAGNDGDGGAAGIIENWLKWLSPILCDPAEMNMRLDTRMNLSDDLLLYGDKISMAFSLEARVPMLDIELVEFVESLPLNYKVSLNHTKIAHKLMAERYLPSEIVHRKKKGFQVPFGNWSRGPWRDYVGEVLLGADSPHLEMLSRDGLESLWQSHLAGKVETRQIFSLFMLALWWRAYHS